MSRLLYLKNRDPDLHLRDARHAHQLFTEHGFALAPKVKFLYHVNFALTPEAQSFSPNSNLYNREIAVLAKSADLPSYRSSVETRNQYNRRKHIQTRIDYSEVAIRFHDDNTGLTRAMLEEYYKYYFIDGRRTNTKEVGPRDKYSQTVNRYGLDNQTTVPFFDVIKLYQLSRQQWFSYTLVNPIITQWSHDSVDSSDGQGIMENSVSVAYESVFYDSGEITDIGEPAGFAAQETRYDFTPSPLTTFDGKLPGGNSLPPTPKLAGVRFQNESPAVDRYSNSFSLRGVGSKQFETFVDLPGAILQTRIPKTNTQRSATISSSFDRSIQILNSDTIISELNQNPSLLNTLTKRILSTGSFSDQWNSRNFNRFDSLPDAEKNSIKNNILSKINTNKKFQQLASQVIASSRSNR
jgi:hypothetical protein